MAGKTILTLSTLTPDRPRVDIDGVVYEMLTEEDMGLLALVELDAVMVQYGDMMRRAQAAPETGERLTKDDADGLSLAMSRVLRLYLDAPPEVHDRLTDQNRMKILQAFSVALGRDGLPPTLAPNRAARRQTTAPSSPRSSASTAASRKAGSS